MTRFLLDVVELNMVEAVAEVAKQVAKKTKNPPPQTIELTPEQREQCLLEANKIVSSHGLTAEFLEGSMAVGVVGDNRAYTPVINLKGSFPGHETLARLSNEISNTLPIVKVTFELPPE